jgi:hypothetical protein
MPNGRSGGFIIEKADLKRLIKTISDANFATIARHPFPPRPVDASEIVQLLEESPKDRFAVEEQDHAWYTIHISNEPEIIWVTIAPDSPVFPEIRQRHEQWNTEHPGWKGWIAF